MRHSTWWIAGLVLAVVPNVGTAAPIVVNQGFNIQGQNALQFILGQDSGVTQLPFYDGTSGTINDNVGTTLKPLTIVPPGLANNGYTLTLTNPGSIFGPTNNSGYTIASATFFVDGINLTGNESITVSVNGVVTQTFNLTNDPSTMFPTANGGLISVPGDDDNAFFTTNNAAVLAALAGNSNFTLTFTRNGATNAVLDGVNIQATLVPEPTTFVTFGLLGAAGFGYIRRRVKGVAVA